MRNDIARHMRIAFLTTDNRDAHRRYDDPDPYFGPAPTALLEGFAMLGGRKNTEIEKLENEEIGNIGSTELGDRNEERRTKNEERRTSPVEPRDTNHELETVPPFEIHVISCTQQPLRAPEKLASNIWYHSLHVPKIGWLRTGYQGCIRAVRRKLRELDPDIVHGQGTERDCAISAVLSGYPNVLTIHGNMAELALRFGAKPGGFHWLMGKLEDFTLPRTAGVFCNSEYTRTLVEGRAKKTWRVDNPIRPEFFFPIPTRRGGSLPILLNVGVIGKRKRQIELLEMAARIHRRGVSLEMRFIGPCAQEPYADEFLKKIGVAEREGYASYIGVLDVEELVNEMDAASGLCHFPSEEAFGLVVAEGVGRDLKFFGSCVGGIPGIVEGIAEAELIDPDDFSTLEERIAGWVAAGAPRPVGGYEMMRIRYHPEVIARRHLEIYSQVPR